MHSRDANIKKILFHHGVTIPCCIPVPVKKNTAVMAKAEDQNHFETTLIPVIAIQRTTSTDLPLSKSKRNNKKIRLAAHLFLNEGDPSHSLKIDIYRHHYWYRYLTDELKTNLLILFSSQVHS
jgi:hypothetical protein